MKLEQFAVYLFSWQDQVEGLKTRNSHLNEGVFGVFLAVPKNIISEITQIFEINHYLFPSNPSVESCCENYTRF